MTNTRSECCNHQNVLHRKILGTAKNSDTTACYYVKPLTVCVIAICYVKKSDVIFLLQLVIADRTGD